MAAVQGTASSNNNREEAAPSFHQQYGEPSNHLQNINREQQVASQDNLPIDNTIQHYELPNLTQLLYEYTNKERDLIQRCFRTGNYNALRELPNRLAPNEILKYAREKQETNINFANPNKPRVNKLSGGGNYDVYEWFQDPYDLYLKTMKAKRNKDKEAIKKVHGENSNFVLGMDSYKWKYEDCFAHPDAKKDYVLPYLFNDDPYEMTHDDVLQAKWLHESKILHGDFKPAQNDKSTMKINKQQLPDIVNYIKKVIMIDWAEVNFIIGTNPDSFIEIKFDQKSVDTDLGLRAYMNTLISTHEVISQFDLRKVLQYWGYKDERHVYFMLAPQWIKFNCAQVYNQVLKQQANQIIKDQQKRHQNREDAANASRDEGKSSVGPFAGDVTQSAIDRANLARIKELQMRNSNFIKEPKLYSEDIEI